MRITGGHARGIQLQSGNPSIRPATDFLRERVFSRLGDAIEGRVILDLFAGSGGYGFEALSRGAAGGTFVERDIRVVAALRDNFERVLRSLQNTDAPPDVRIVIADVFRWAPRRSEPFDFIFLDPPYELPPARLQRILRTCHHWLAPRRGARLICEHPGELDCGGCGWDLERRLGGRGRRAPSAHILSSSAP